jgi:hypothetical protein
MKASEANKIASEVFKKENREYLNAIEMIKEAAEQGLYQLDCASLSDHTIRSLFDDGYSIDSREKFGVNYYKINW